MNHDLHTSNPEGETDGQPDSGYNEWREAMDGVEFKGDAPTIGQEEVLAPIASEKQEKSVSKIEKLFKKIQDIKDYILSKSSAQNGEKIAEMTDDALVYVARETITAADEDGVRTEAEAAEIEDAVSTVVVQGAMEEAGVEQPTEKNPILELNEGDTQPDLIASIETLHEEGVMLPGGESVAGLAMRTIERDKEWDLTQVSGQLGSNEGGWYESPSGERFYVKFYENPSQGQAEFVANAIYAKLGIKAVRSEVIQLDGREAIASPAVPEATFASEKAQRESEDVQKGFVADAFLANWDVVGLVYDNIVQGEGGFYRIDNGGSLIFRAQGGDKVYSPDFIPELQSMRMPGRPAGEVFAGITEDEIGRQARELVSKISPEDIRAIVDESGLEGDARERILAGLLGRREYLARVYGKPEFEEQSNPEIEEHRPWRSVSEAVRALRSREAERTNETVVRPRAEIVCDHGHIEGQKIDVINKKDRGVIEFRFKLRDPIEAVAALMMRTEDGMENEQAEATTPSGAVLSRERIVYEGIMSGDSYVLCDASVFEKEGVKVFIADPSLRNGDDLTISGTRNDSHLVRTAMGLVKVEAPFDMDPETTERILGEILEKDLGVPDALSEVPEEAEREYKMARYGWQHVLDGDLTPEQIEEAEKLEREEVFPGYTTYVERGRHKEYLEKYGEDIRAVHLLYTGSASSIYRVLTQGLMCTTERYSRGVLRIGLSSRTDMDTGGADNAFTRVSDGAQRGKASGVLVVFKPEIFDRTDWYSYECDYFGSTDDDLFDKRLSPDGIFARVVDPNSYSSGNEQMFRTGIGAQYVESIEVDPDSRNRLIAELRSMGLEEIDGRPIEEIVVARASALPPDSADSSKDSVDNLSNAAGDSGDSSDIQDGSGQTGWDYTDEQEQEENSSQMVEEYFKKQEQEKAEKQAKMQALINGEVPYTTIDEMTELANASDDFYASFKSMVEAAIVQGKKEQLSSDFAEYLEKEISLDVLQKLASGETPDGFEDEDMEFVSYLQNTFGIDFGALYQEALALQSEEEPWPDWPDDWED